MNKIRSNSRSSRTLGYSLSQIVSSIQSFCKRLVIISLLISISMYPIGSDKLLFTRFYAHIVRSRLEYGSAINQLTASQIKTLELAQNEPLRRIYDGSKRVYQIYASFMVFAMNERRINTPQARFLFLSFTLLEGALLTKFMPHIQHDRHQIWHERSKSSLQKSVPPSDKGFRLKTFKSIKKLFLQQNLDSQT